MGSVDKRRYPRVSANNKVRIWSPIMDDGHVVGTLEQLSLGGCLFSTPISFESGRVLTFKIDLMDKELVAVGEIVYRRMKDETSFICGVRFEYLAPGDVAQLKALIAANTMENVA